VSDGQSGQEVQIEEEVLPRNKRRRPPDPPVFINSRPRRIGPRDMIVNLSLNKIKLESDYVAPLLAEVKLEPITEDNQDILDSSVAIKMDPDEEIKIEFDQMVMDDVAEALVDGYDNNARTNFADATNSNSNNGLVNNHILKQ